MAHRVNMSEGFRRLAAVASLLLLIAGCAITAVMYTSARRVWLEAHAQPVGKQLVLLPGVTYSFPNDATKSEILEAVESKDGWKVRLNDEAQEVTDYRIADIKVGEQVGCVYVPKGWWAASQTSGQSVLYDRRALLEAERAGSLRSPLTSLVRDLRAKGAFPAPPPSPSVTLALAAGATVLASVSPWLLFIVVSWVVRGFTAPTPGSGAA